MWRTILVLVTHLWDSIPAYSSETFGLQFVSCCRSWSCPSLWSWRSYNHFWCRSRWCLKHNNIPCTGNHLGARRCPCWCCQKHSLGIYLLLTSKKLLLCWCENNLLHHLGLPRLLNNLDFLHLRIMFVYLWGSGKCCSCIFLLNLLWRKDLCWCDRLLHMRKLRPWLSS